MISHNVNPLCHGENTDPVPKSAAIIQSQAGHYRRGLVPGKRIVLEYEPMLDPAFGPLCFLVQRPRFQDLVLNIIRHVNKAYEKQAQTSRDGIWAKKHKYEFVRYI